MNINRPHASALHTRLQRAVVGFAVIATILGLAAVLLVYRTMTAFNAKLMQGANATQDQALLDAIIDNSRTMNLILAAIVLVAALNIAAGIIMMRCRPQ